MTEISWEKELENSNFYDLRIKKRLLSLINSLSKSVGSSIPFACQDWANTKGAYRFLSSEKFSEEEILQGHFESTASRVNLSDGPILILHDTTEITFNRKSPQEIGYTRKCANRKGLFDHEIQRAMCGILMHTSLAITPEGVPLGLTANKFWSRDKFKNAKALYRGKNATRIPIEEKESYRWLDGVSKSNKVINTPGNLVHIGDRESDIFEFFTRTIQEKSHFLVRVKVDRRSDKDTIFKNISKSKIMGVYNLCYRDRKGNEINTMLDVRAESMIVRPPFGPKSNIYPDLNLTVITARERREPNGRERIEWKLMTDLSVVDFDDAVEKLKWYSLRWKIEVFFKVLKSGCKITDSKLRTAESLSKMIAINCLVAWRIFWMTMISREGSSVTNSLGITSIERIVLDKLKPDSSPSTLSSYYLKIAKLGGYLARASDAPPGNTVMWRGFSKLKDIVLGIEIGKEIYG
jgi:hypothetical protein